MARSSSLVRLIAITGRSVSRWMWAKYVPKGRLGPIDPCAAPLGNDRCLRIPAEDRVAVKPSIQRATVDVAAATAHVRSPVPASHPSAALQCKPTRQTANETAPTKTSVMAQVASRLNQLRDTNLSPR
jgi:hypothetical protein